MCTINYPAEPLSLPSVSEWGGEGAEGLSGECKGMGKREECGRGENLMRKTDEREMEVSRVEKSESVGVG